MATENPAGGPGAAPQPPEPGLLPPTPPLPVGRPPGGAVPAETAVILLCGCAVALVVAQVTSRGDLSDGLLWSLYTAGAAGVATILGLIFGLPRVRPDHEAESSERFYSNSNLEQISDWLTKILVGAGLVELKDLPGSLRSSGDFLGRGMSTANPAAYAASAIVFGGGVGFVGSYLWARLRLRFLLEEGERAAAAASRAEQLVARLKGTGGGIDEPPESTAVLRRAATSALAVADAASARPRRAVLWVDDHPANNTFIADALRSLGIRVDLARCTQEGVAKIAATSDYGLVITDLGRWEDGKEDPMAGLHLIEVLRRRGDTMPVIVFATRRALDHEAELRAKGANLVTSHGSEVFEQAVRLVT